jgi:hypothetical protein
MATGATAARAHHWRTLAIAIAATFVLAAAVSAASAEDSKPAEPAAGVAADGADTQGCPYAKDGAPCCTSCREKAALAASGDTKAAGEAGEGGCPCQRRARLQQKAQEQQGETSAP